MMTRYCSGRAVKANKSLEQEVTRQRDVAELKAHVLKHKLLASKTANDQVTPPPPPSPSTQGPSALKDHRTLKHALGKHDRVSSLIPGM